MIFCVYKIYVCMYACIYGELGYCSGSSSVRIYLFVVAATVDTAEGWATIADSLPFLPLLFARAFI